MAHNSPHRGVIYSSMQGQYGTGYVAVVTHEDHKNGVIKAGEQHYSNKRWPGDFARKIDLVKRRWIRDCKVADLEFILQNQSDSAMLAVYLNSLNY